MLQIVLMHPWLIECQEDYRRSETMWGARMALTISTVRALLHAQSQSFNRRQRSRAVILPDGRSRSVQDLVLNPYAREGWPSRAAAILHGIGFPPISHLPMLPCREDGAAFYDLDPFSYVAQLDIGPAQARRFGDLTLLVVYLDLVNRMHILWIGAVSDVNAALDRIVQRTSGLTDWRTVDSDYQDLLLARCR